MRARGFIRRGAGLSVSLALAATVVLGSAPVAPTRVAAQPPPFDANGRDDSFLIAQSRAQGPVIRGGAGQKSMAVALEAAAGDPVRGSFGSLVDWPIMPIHAVLLPDGRVLSYGTEPNGT